ncbi:MAG: hypothetical protein Q8W51_08320 [Candidatus Palauibacterales bacterium]|nr:hypothetical protein [Candidatus Palauibacterales bacterium]
MSGLVVWLIIIVFFVSMNRVFGAVGRGMTGEEGTEEGGGPGPGGRSGSGSRGSLRQELLRQLAEAAEREARARSGERQESEIRWRPGLGGGAPLGVATGGRSGGAGGEVSEPSGAGVPATSRSAAAAGAGLAAVSGRAATLPAWPERTALQRAVLYEAILGPPLSLRGEREGPLGP